MDSKDAIVQALMVSMHTFCTIDTVPQYAVRLAKICSVWSEFEHTLVLAYSGILQTPYAVAKHALHNSSNTNSRAKMVRSACAEFPPSAEFEAALSLVLSRVSSLAANRAKYVHGRWVVRGDGKVFLVDPSAAEHSQAAMRAVSIHEMDKLIANTMLMKGDLEALVDQTRPLPTLPDSIAQRSVHIREKTRKDQNRLARLRQQATSRRKPDTPTAE